LKRIIKILLIISTVIVLAFLCFFIVGLLVVQDKFEPEIHKEVYEDSKTIVKPLVNKNLVSFLEKPIDLLEFKNKTKTVTTGVSKGANYLYKPNNEESIYYCYYFPNDRKRKLFKINKITVFKYGENKHVYDDDTETLISLDINYSDPNLEQANLVGQTKKQIEAKFGLDFSISKKNIIYKHNNNILIINLNNSKVIAYRYLRLNTDVIDQDLINRMVF